MPAWKFFSGAGAAEEAPTGQLSVAAANEFAKRGFVLVPLVTIAFPSETSILTFSPTSTPLQSAGHTTSGGGGGEFYEALDDPEDSPDDDTTYVRTGSANDTTSISRLGFDTLPENVVSIEEVRVYFRAKVLTTNVNGSWTFGVHVNGTTYFRDGGSQYDRFFNTLYKTIVYRFPVSPDTLAAWTRAEFDALQVEFQSMPDALGLGTGGQRFTQCYLQADVVTEEIGRYSYVPWNSRSRGFFEPVMLDIEDAARSVLSEQNALEGSTCGITIVDPDRKFSDYIAGGRKVHNAAVTVEWASPDLDPTDWLTTYKGVLANWKEEGVNVWKLLFDREQNKLTAVNPSVKFTETDFNDAPDDTIYGNFAPIIYGSHKSTGLNDDGMVTLWRVSDYGFMSSRARIKGHNAVYTISESGGAQVVTLLTKDTDWQEDFPIINGRQWSRVTLIGASKDTNKVLELRADVEGIEEVGDGTGFLITNPALILLHWLTNFVFNDYQAGLWIQTLTTEPIDLDRFIEARDYFNRGGQAASRYMAGAQASTTAIQELNRFTDQLEIKAFWTRDGKIAIRPNTPFTIEVYPDDNIIEEGLHDLIDPDYNVDDTSLVSKILMNYLHQQATGEFLANATVEDVDIENAGDRNIQAVWLPSANPGEILGEL